MTDSPDPVDAFSLLGARAGDPPHIRLLRRAVIGMGIVLVAGFAAVIGRVSYLMTQTAPPAVMAKPDGDPLPVDALAVLPVGAKARQHSVSGSTLSVLYEAPGGDGIIILDLRTGRQISHIRLQPQSK